MTKRGNRRNRMSTGPNWVLEKFESIQFRVVSQTRVSVHFGRANKLGRLDRQCGTTELSNSPTPPSPVYRSSAGKGLDRGAGKATLNGNTDSRARADTDARPPSPVRPSQSSAAFDPRHPRRFKVSNQGANRIAATRPPARSGLPDSSPPPQPNSKGGAGDRATRSGQPRPRSEPRGCGAIR